MAWVYLIRNGDLHKIGRTDNLERRMKQLQPDEIVQILETDRSRDLEHELHKLFKAKRLPQSEYFRLEEAEVNTARCELGWEPGARVPLVPIPGTLGAIRQQAERSGMYSLGLIVLVCVFGVWRQRLDDPLASVVELGLVIAFWWNFIAFTTRSVDCGLRWSWRRLKSWTSQ